MKMSDVFELPLTSLGLAYNSAIKPSATKFDVLDAVATAVNAHDALVEALKHARNQIQHPDQMIDEALDLAEGRQ